MTAGSQSTAGPGERTASWASVRVTRGLGGVTPGSARPPPGAPPPDDPFPRSKTPGVPHPGDRDPHLGRTHPLAGVSLTRLKEPPSARDETRTEQQRDDANVAAFLHRGKAEVLEHEADEYEDDRHREPHARPSRARRPVSYQVRFLREISP